jgi:predicted transcriptional regulator
MNEDVFTGSIDELLEHVTDNQQQLIKEADNFAGDDFAMFERMLESMVDEGLLRKEIINGETFYSNNQEDKL